MEKKFKISGQPRRVKIIYAAVIGVLCVTAVVIGIVSSASKKTVTPLDQPSVNIPDTDEEISGEIGEEAFMGCTALATVRLTGNNTKIGTRAFADCTTMQQIFLLISQHC